MALSVQSLLPVLLLQAPQAKGHFSTAISPDKLLLPQRDPAIFPTHAQFLDLFPRAYQDWLSEHFAEVTVLAVSLSLWQAPQANGHALLAGSPDVLVFLQREA